MAYPLMWFGAIATILATPIALFPGNLSETFERNVEQQTINPAPSTTLVRQQVEIQRGSDLPLFVMPTLVAKTPREVVASKPSAEGQAARVKSARHSLKQLEELNDRARELQDVNLYDLLPKKDEVR